MFSLLFSLTSPSPAAQTYSSVAVVQPSQSLLNRVPYNPAPWIATHIRALPSHKINLGRLPTPSHPISIPGLEESGLICTIKRDDLSSFDMSGNKVRKLEFLLSDYADYDSVITIGGIQSNHARSTAVASRQLGLDPFLILRAQDTVEVVQQSITGNLLLDRMMGADIRLVSPGTYARIGSAGLTDQLCKQLRNEGRNPLVIPVGGSNALGAFGYLEAVQEIQRQFSCEGEGKIPFDHIVFACGSGGTAAGLTLGCKLSGISATCLLHAVGPPSLSPLTPSHPPSSLSPHPLLSSQVRFSGDDGGPPREKQTDHSHLRRTAFSAGRLLTPQLHTHPPSQHTCNIF